MVLIIACERPKMNMTQLMLAVLKFIYEEKTMDSKEIYAFQDAFVSWNKYFEWKREYHACTRCNGNGYHLGVKCYECDGNKFNMPVVDEELMHQLQEVAKLYYLNMEGKFDERKKLFECHGIDWKKFHGVPGAVTEEDKARAQLEYDKLKKANPEEYE